VRIIMKSKGILLRYNTECDTMTVQIEVMSMNNSFAERLKKLRKNKGYTQVTLAEELGVSKGTVAMWETGKRTPDYEIINIMSELFDRRIDYILGFSDDDVSLKLSKERVEDSGKWEVRCDLADFISQYLRLDAYGRMNVDALIHRETIRCREQRTERDIETVEVGIRMEEP